MPATAAPLLADTAPFASDQRAALNAVLGQSTAEQRLWLSGFLAGYAAASASPSLAVEPPRGLPPAPAARAAEPLTILYATESGNSEKLAAVVQAQAKRRGFKPTVKDMADVSASEAAAARNLVVIAATWGEGEPPQRAMPFLRQLMADTSPRFERTRFAVLALGDTAYVNFCQTGREVDARLEALGGQRAAPRADLDLDYEVPAQRWIETTLGILLPAEVVAPIGAEIIRLHPEPVAATLEPARLADRGTAELQERRLLSSSRSTKTTWHVELALDGDGLAYEPGDSLAITPENDPATVEAVLAAVGLAGDADFAARLHTRLDVTTLSRPTLERWQVLRPQPKLAQLLAGDGWRAFLEGRQLVDLLEKFSARVDAAEFSALLRPLPARSYSIASSPLAHPGEAHLLVGLVEYDAHGRQRTGVASGFLGRRLQAGASVPVQMKPNRHFRLPTDPSQPIVMVGPGTGLAPFRAFLQHRREMAAPGRNWLVFGERTSMHDFHYQLELQALEADGFLHRLDVAFSRDQPEKVYVQHRLWAQRAELWAWLQEGAHLYVCGDASQMAKDVEATLLRVAADQGGLDGPAAQAWLDGLAQAARYQRDVY